MSRADQQQESIIREVPLEDLEPPETDVREGRDPDGLRNLARSMEQNGQIVPASAHIDPELLPEGTAALDTAGLEKLYEQAEAVRITDGWSRRHAADILDWPTLRCEIHRQDKSDQIVSQLAANTDRLDMNKHEQVVAIRDYKRDSGDTQAEIAEKTGMSESYLSDLLNALDEPAPIVQAWANPDSHIEAGHVLAIKQLDDPDSKKRTFNSVVTHDQGVTATRRKVQNEIKERRSAERTEKKPDEPARPGLQDREEDLRNDDTRQQEPDDPCVFCGDQQAARIYIPVCEEDYHVVAQARDAGEPIMADPEEQPPADES